MSNWLTIIIAVLIVLVIADGIRRTLKARRSRLYESPSLKKSLKNTAPVEEVEEKPSYLSELPNGGARVVGYRDPKDIPLPKPLATSNKAVGQTQTVAPKVPEQVRLNLSESVPILMQPEKSSAQSETADKKFQRIEPTISSDSFVDSDSDIENPFKKPQESGVQTHSNERAESKVHPSFTRAELKGEESIKTDSKSVHSPEIDDEYEEDDGDYDDDDRYQDEYDEVLDEDEDFIDDDDEYLDDDNIDDEEDLDEDWEDPEVDEPNDQRLVEQPAQEKKPQLVEPEEVIVINVMAQRAQVFEGNALLDIVLKCGLRFGNMNIFHRYSGNKGDGTLLFSMANIVKPGTFDLDAMDEFTTLGVSLFLTLPLDADSLQSFELMLETAQAIAQTLDGELKDEYRSVMTKQTIEHYRQRIRDFERKKLFRRPQ